jgi:hypothetical protein
MTLLLGAMILNARRARIHPQLGVVPWLRLHQVMLMGLQAIALSCSRSAVHHTMDEVSCLHQQQGGSTQY